MSNITDIMMYKNVGVTVSLEGSCTNSQAKFRQSILYKYLPLLKVRLDRLSLEKQNHHTTIRIIYGNVL